MEHPVTRVMELAQITAALDRAAAVATTGNSDDRSGKANMSVASVALRLRNEMRIVTLNWANVQALNNKIEGLREPLLRAEAWEPVVYSSRALLRDVVMTLMRLSDGNTGNSNDNDNSRQSLCRLMYLFESKSDNEISDETGADRQVVENGMKFLRARVPARWSSDVRLVDDELRCLRANFKPVRDSLIAHALDHGSLDLRFTLNSTNEFFNLVSRLVDAACMVCNVERDDLDERWEEAMRLASNYWRVVAAGCGAAPAPSILHTD